MDNKQLVEDFRRDGVVRIRSVFSVEMVSEIRTELERYIRDDLPAKPADARTLEADGTSIRNLWRLEQHHPYFRELGQRIATREFIAPLVGGKPVLAGVETFNNPPHVGSGVPPHQDNAYFCQKPPDMLTLWVAIDPVTRANGAVYFVKGSHKLGLLPTKPTGVTGNSIGLAEPPVTHKSDKFCATLAPGDVTIHHCETIHHSEPNRTDQSRLALLLVYRGSHTATDVQLQATYSQAVAATPPA